MIAPKTLSREVQSAIRGKPLPDCLLDKPQMLFKFVVQAASDLNFTLKHGPICNKAICALTRFICLGVFSSEEVSKVAFLITHFRFITYDHSTFLDDFTFIGAKKMPFPRIMLYPHCSELMKRWKKNPDEKACSITEYGSELTIDTFYKLYTAITSRDFSLFRSFKIEALVPLLRLCRAFGNERGFIELQKICCSKITQFELALKWLGFSKNEFPLIEEYCRAFLDNTELYVSEYVKKPLYVSVSFSCESQTDEVQEAYNFDWAQLMKGYLQYNAQKYVSKLIVNLHFFSAMREKWLLVSSKSFTLTDFEKMKGQYLSSKKILFKDLITESLNFDLKGQVDANIIAGICVYFSHVNNIEFSAAREPIPLKEISNVRNDIQSITFTNFNKPLSPNIFDNLGMIYPSLTAFNFGIGTITKEQLTAALKVKGIVKLELSICRIELPNDLSIFSRITSLELIANDFPSRQLLALFKAATSLKILKAVNVQNFTLSEYPYPKNITSLTTEFERVFRDRESLSTFSNLNVINFIEKFDGRLPELYHYLFNRNCGTVLNFMGGFT